MAKLILSMDGLVLKEIPLTKERTTIGRRPHNDIQIENLAISGDHAVLVSILDDAFLEDLNSTNGTLVNGQPIKKHVLHSGDLIELGKYKLKYLIESAQPGTIDATEQTLVSSPDAPTIPLPELSISRALAAAAASPAAAPAATAAPLLGVVRILSGSNAGREMELVKNLTTLGKPGVQVAVIARRPHGYFITHVEGEPLPTVNGKPLETQAHPLADRDVVQIAGVQMEFFLRR